MAKPALASKNTISKFFKCELLYILWGEPTGEKTTYCQSLQLTDNRIVNKINLVSSLPIHYWSIFKGSDFRSASGHYYLDKLLDKAGVLLKTDQMLIQQLNKEDAHYWETKACSAYRPERVLFQTPAMGLISLDSSTASSINRETKVPIGGRWWNSSHPDGCSKHKETHLSLKGPLRACSTLIID